MPVLLTSLDACVCRPIRSCGDLSMGSVLGRGLTEVTVGHWLLVALVNIDPVTI